MQAPGIEPGHESGGRVIAPAHGALAWPPADFFPRAGLESRRYGLRLRRSGDAPADSVVTRERWRDLVASYRIRCPICFWHPDANSRWCCSAEGTPEPPFPSCGTIWNTFATRGRCPGCQHQWQWTSCLLCGEASLHEAWYETGTGDPS